MEPSNTPTQLADHRILNESQQPATEQEDVEVAQEKQQPKQISYTAFDRDLIHAAKNKNSITFFLLGFIPAADTIDKLQVIAAVPVSVDKYMVKVRTSDGREIWLSKQFIVAVELRGKF